eukprot:CAMPEP_0196663424 /NCGR_PEP_ID=MMETSP1086-20130531/52808_1 /TAXON_ID=77921 /ORGANISM="Cyanoptyche  gloeocystis , Strain SAG4.97" /LENGTH=30 /DNA_ID= /DNA_START= /DNA_END= /DNA_ORIENTATION=
MAETVDIGIWRGRNGMKCKAQRSKARGRDT